MLSFKKFKEMLTEEISVDDLGKFYGGYDKVVNTTAAENPNQPPGGSYSDRKWYNYCYDGPNTYDDYMGGNYTLP